MPAYSSEGVVSVILNRGSLRLGIVSNKLTDLASTDKSDNSVYGSAIDIEENVFNCFRNLFNKKLQLKYVIYDSESEMFKGLAYGEIDATSLVTPYGYFKNDLPTFFQSSCASFSKEVVAYSSLVYDKLEYIYQEVNSHPFMHKILVQREEDIDLAKAIFGNSCEIGVETDTARAYESLISEKALAYIPHPFSTYSSVFRYF